MASEEVRIDVGLDVKEALRKLDDLDEKIDALDRKDGRKGGYVDGLGSKAKAAAVAVGKAAAAGAVATGAAFAATTRQALAAYADYEQLKGGVETLFKDSAGTVMAYSREAWKTAGLSANEYMELATSTSAAMISSLNGDTARAAELTNMSIVDISDNVNKMGSKIEDVKNAYGGFAKQNYTMLDNLKLGYGGTKQEMQRLIDKANELRAQQGEAADLSIENYSDIVEAIHEVQDNMDITGTTAKEAATTISGSASMAKAAWQDWLTGLGDSEADMGQLTDNLLEALDTVATLVAPRVVQIAETLVSEFPKVVQRVVAALPGIVGPVAASVVEALPAIAAAVAETIPGILAQVKGAVVEALPAIAAAVAEAIPGILAQVKGALVAATSALGDETGLYFFGALQSTFEGFDNLVATVREKFAIIGEAMSDPVITEALQAIIDLVDLLAPTLGTMLGSAITAVATLFADLVLNVSYVVVAVRDFAEEAVQFFGSDVPAAVSSMGAFFSGIPATVRAAVAAGLGHLASFASGVAARAAEAGNGFLNGVKSGFSSAIGFVQGIPGRILGALGNLGSLLVDSGRSMLEGLASGISQGFRNAVSAVSEGLSNLRSYFPFSPAKRGPFSGRGYTTFSGRALMRDFAGSIEAAAPAAVSAVSDALEGVQASFGFDIVGQPATVPVSATAQYDTETGLRGAIDSLSKRVEQIASTITEPGFRQTNVTLDGRRVGFGVSGYVDGALGLSARRATLG